MSKIVPTTLLCLFLASGVHAQLPVTDGLIVHLRADSLVGLQDGDPVTVWIDSAQDDSVDGTVGDVGSGTPEYKADVLFGKPVVRFNGAEALSSAQFAINASAGATVVAVFTGDKSGALHERLGHFGAWDAAGGVSISMDVCTQQGTNEGSGFRLNNGWSLAGNPNPMDTNFHVGVWQAGQGTLQSALIYYLDGVKYSLRQNNPNNTVIFPDTGNVVAVGDGHSPGGAFYSGDFVTADLAVFIVYNRVLSDAEVQSLSQYLRQEYLEHAQAVNPTPAAGAEVSTTFVSLAWEAGAGAVSHRVYLDTDQAAVAARADAALVATVATAGAVIGLPGQPLPGGLIPGSTYYWLVEEIAGDGSTAPGPVWSFSVPPTTAYEPVPGDGVEAVTSNQVLSWKPGLGALLHYVYIGKDADAVAGATGGAPLTTATYAPPTALEPDTTYYWRVDEFTQTGVAKGRVWSFKTLAPIPVTDPSLIGWWTMDPANAPSLVDMSGHGLHGTVTSGQVEWVEGPDGAAVVLDMDDVVTVPAPNITTNTITMTGWLKAARVHGRVGLIFHRAGASTCGINLMPGNQLGYHWLDIDTTWQYQSNLIVPVNEWSFVALVVQPDRAMFYMDGTDIRAEHVFAHDPATFDGALQLGYDSLNATRRFVGALDDLRFYNRALDEDEIRTVMNAGSPPANVADPMVVESFDAYNAYTGQAGENVWDVWADGYGGNGTGSTAGYTAEPFMSRTVLAPGTGAQALPFGYNNTGSFVDIEGKLVSRTVSEISRRFNPTQDLTRDGATGLTLWIKGDAANAVQAGDSLYLVVKDAAGKEATVVVAQPADLLKFYWQKRTVALSALSGVDWAGVKEILLGIGNRAMPATGGQGTVLIDDIMLAIQ